MKYCAIVILRAGVVHRSALLCGENEDELIRQGEIKFIEECKKINPEFGGHVDPYTDATVSDVMECGYYEYQDHCICFTWPQDIINIEGHAHEDQD